MTTVLLLSLLACDQSPLLVRNVSVFTGERLVAARDVLFANGRVAKVGKKDSFAHSGRSMDGSGNTLLPGLIDSHLHFSIPGLPAGADAGTISGRQLLRSGVTAGRLHLASVEKALEWKALGAEECATFPALSAGSPGIAGGAPNLNGTQYGGVKNTADAREKVQRYAAAGLDWVALHDIEKFSSEELQALREEARTRGLKIFVAATTFEQARIGLAIKADSIDYIDRSPAAGYPPDLLALWRKLKLAAVPTIGIFACYAACREGQDCPTGRESPFFAGAIAEAVAAQLRNDLAGNSYVRESAAFWPTLPRKLRELRATGAPVLIGTDVGSPAYLHHGAIWWEMEAWKRMGVPAIDVLRAATSLPARLLGWSDRGILREGAVADFVLYQGNPLEGSFALDRVRAVGRRGRLLVESGRWVGP